MMGRDESSGRGVRARSLLRGEERAPRTARATILVVAGLLVAAGFWSATTEIGELARADGEIAPSGELLRVDHFDGGVVRSVSVAPGDVVEAGALLATLDQPALRTERAELDRQIEGIERDVARLRRLLAGEAPETRIASAGDDFMADYARAERALFLARQRLLADRIAARREGVAAAATLRDSAIRRVGLSEETLGRFETLKQKGLVSATQLFLRRDATESIRAELIQAEAGLTRAAGDLDDSERALEEARLGYRETHLKELHDLARENQRLRLALSEVEARIEGLEIRAPAAGVIQSSAISTVGEVIPPGGAVFELLPTTQRLVAVIRISPTDIGHVAEGHAVRLKPTTFDARRYGELTGRIESISATSVASEREEPYFRTIVALDDEFIGAGAFRRRVRAGMVVAAEIETARRTVFAYLLKPIERSLSKAMTER